MCIFHDQFNKEPQKSIGDVLGPYSQLGFPSNPLITGSLFLIGEPQTGKGQNDTTGNLSKTSTYSPN